MAATCTHLDTIDDTLERDRGEGCVECLKIGSRWVHLRQCMQCGEVLCCDDSPMRHATAHNARDRTPDHPVARARRVLVLVLSGPARVRALTARP